MEKLFYASFGVLLGWVANQYRLVVAENANLIGEHIKDIESFCTVAQDYWLSNPETAEDERILAAKVRARHAAIGTFYGEASKRMTLDRLREYQVLQLELFSIATGGNFETASRKMDPNIAIETYRLSSEVVHLLRLAKREQISMRVLLYRARELILGKYIKEK